MTIHLVTVGTTARAHLADLAEERPSLTRWIDNEGHPRDAQRLGVDEHDPQQAADLLSRLANGDSATRDLAKKAIAETGVDTWPNYATAESTTLATVTGHATVAPDDLVVLIATATVPGLLSAFWNAALLLRGDFDRLDYLDDPPTTWDEREGQRLRDRDRLLVAQIRSLDLSRPKDLGAAMRRLGHLGRLVLESHANEEIVVHLSGGYKATIPFMIGIAEGLRSVRATPGAEPPKVKAYVVHEDSKPPTKIEVPLRRFKPNSVTTELGAFATSPTTQADLSGKTLEGYAYDREGNSWKLNEFGEGLVALIGENEQVP